MLSPKYIFEANPSNILIQYSTRGRPLSIPVTWITTKVCGWHISHELMENPANHPVSTTNHLPDQYIKPKGKYNQDNGKVLSEKFQMKSLLEINRCRMFLRDIIISNITIMNGQYIYNNLLCGIKRCQ